MPRIDSTPGREEPLCFGPFHIQVAAKQVWRGAEKLALRPLPVRVLTYLVRHPGRVVETEELLQAIWAGTQVSRTVIRVCVREIRRVLGDDAAAPRYIETVGRQGYRFIGKVAESQPAGVRSQQQSKAARPSLATATWQRTTHVFGREEELTQLQAWFDKASTGQRQLVFITEETGVGKTTLVDHFLDRVQTRDPVWVGRGQCIEHYGAGEAYLPALAAQDQREVGIPLLRQGLAALTALGVRLGRPHLLALQVDAYKQAGQIEEGFTTLAEALTQVRETGERYYEAELYRLKGELTLQRASVQRGPSKTKGKRQNKSSVVGSQVSASNPQLLTPGTQEAEACFRQAIEVARGQEAKAWELRAATSLSRLWQQQGKREEARALLSQIYGWFTEGFDTKDLQEAKALLAELA